MKSMLLSFAVFCAFIGTALAVQSIHQPFSKLKLTDGRVLENARLKVFNADSVFVRDDDGIVQVPYKLFPEELQPQLAKARAAALAQSSAIPDRGTVSSPSSPAMVKRPPAMKPPFSYEPLGVNSGNLVESICFYDRCREIFGAESWARVLRWASNGLAVNVFEAQGSLWAWNIRFGFRPLNVSPESKEDAEQVSTAVWAGNPASPAPQGPYYWSEPPQQPETDIPTVQNTSEIPAVRDATLAGARLGAHRPVNVVQFSCGGGTQQSAAVVFVFDGQYFIYFPERGAVHYVGGEPNSLLNVQQLRYEINQIFPGVSDLKSLNHTGSAPVNGAAQN
jgi:hypothetical protein